MTRPAPVPATTPPKSTVGEIRARFDADVDRFSNLEVGQEATIDSPLHMDLLTSAAALASPHAQHLLDIGCGAGNYALKLLQHLPHLQATLIDLSEPMLTRASDRLHSAAGLAPQTRQGDVRDLDLGCEEFDIVLAAQCLHHLRDEAEWLDVFSRVFESLRPGGGFWISDLVAYNTAAVRHLMHERWGKYLVQLRDEAYRDQVFGYVEREDSPRPLTFQLDLLRQVGFATIEVLHVNNCFASFGGIK